MLAWFSKLDSGLSAYTSKELLPCLKDKTQIKIFSDFDGEFLGETVHHYSKAVSLAPFDAFIYLVEEDSFADSYAQTFPGLCLYHGPIREQFFSSTAKVSQACLYPTERLVNLHKTNSKTPVFYLPSPAKIIEPNKQDEFQVCFCGSAKIEDRAQITIEALEELSFVDKVIWLADKSRKDEILKRFSSSKKIEFVFNKNPETWAKITSCSKAAIHTHFGPYENPEPYASISISSGCPAIVSHFSDTELYPEGVFFKIQTGEFEKSELKEVLRNIKDKDLSKEVLLYSKEEHCSEKIADELLLVVKSLAKEPLPAVNS